MTLLRWLLIAPALSCSGGSEDEAGSGSSCEASLPSWTAQAESDDDGVIEVLVESDGSLRSALITVGTDDDSTLLHLYEVEDPDGDTVFESSEWWSSTDILTMAPYPIHSTSTANWPVIPSASSTLDSGTWTFRFKSLNGWNYSNSSGEDVLVTVHENHRSETKRCLHVRFVLAEGISDNDTLMGDLETAQYVFEGILLRHNVVVHSSWHESSLDPVLPSPGEGDVEFLELVEEGPEDTLHIVIGESVEIVSEGLAGESGGIPGALHPTEHSAVIIAWLELAGISGSLDDSEVQMLGETIAHEAGHYMGLVHPVQFDEDLNIVAWDALEDTSNCNDVDVCLDRLAGNLMFPYLLCDWTDWCDAQDELTDQQAGVMRNYTGVR